MQTLILCGGKGTRAYPLSVDVPKPMLAINGQPILEHVMRIYANQGHTDFILSLGYKKEVIIDYFNGRFPSWSIEFVDTGLDTNTGGRIQKCQHILDDTFFATYADGLSDIDLNDLLAFHRSHSGLATVTTVRLPSQYGTMSFDDEGCVVHFEEKPVLPDYWINGGFFVFDREAWQCWEGECLETEVLPGLSRRGMLYGYRHKGFWKSMDTHKDQQELNKMYEQGILSWLEASPNPVH